MSIALLELAAAALGDLVEQVVFVGGAAVGLWIIDPAAPPPRPTKDVDVIVAASRTRFAEFEQRLREHPFHEDVYSGIMCRWLHPDGELVLDAMPTNPTIRCKTWLAFNVVGWECYDRGSISCRAAPAHRPPSSSTRAVFRAWSGRWPRQRSAIRPPGTVAPRR